MRRSRGKIFFAPDTSSLGQKRKNRKSPRPPQQSAGREILKTSKVLPTLHTLQNIKRSYFFHSLFSYQQTVVPLELSASRLHAGVMKVWTFLPRSPWQTPVPALNGVTEVRLEMLTNVGEVIFTNRIQESPGKEERTNQKQHYAMV